MFGTLLTSVAPALSSLEASSLLRGKPARPLVFRFGITRSFSSVEEARLSGEQGAAQFGYVTKKAVSTR
jgi:hypothetical protein